MKNIFFVLFYLVEAMKFIYGYRIIFQEKMRWKWGYSLGIMIYTVLLFLYPHKQLLLGYAILFLFTIVNSTDSIIIGFKNTIILEIFMISLDSMIEMMVELFDPMNMQDGIKIQLVTNFGKLLFVILIYFLQKVYRKKQVRMRENSIIYWSAVLLIPLCFEIAFGRYLMEKYVTGINKRSYIVMIIIGYVCVAFLIAIIKYEDKINTHIKEKYEIERKFSKKKEEYYGMLLKREEDTRRYRHDIKNHLIYINELNKNREHEKIDEYLKQISNKLEIIQNKKIVVGNSVIEILTNYYIMKLPSHIRVSIEGHLSEKISISTSDLSSIYGNILENAVEELTQTEGEGAYLNISFSEGEQLVECIVRNSIKKNEKKRGRLRRKKQDLRDHGWGIRNISDIVKANGGELYIVCEEEFMVRVILHKNMNHLSN